MYFTIKELCKSDTAEKYNINNTPTPQVTLMLKKLIAFLNPIREKWGSAIIITSGYRCEKLNKMLNGSKTSAHLIGAAADLVPANNKMAEFKKFIKDYMKDKIFDQVILEKSGKKEWVHIGLVNQKGKQRKMIFNIE